MSANHSKKAIPCDLEKFCSLVREYRATLDIYDEYENRLSQIVSRGNTLELVAYYNRMRERHCDQLRKIRVIYSCIAVDYNHGIAGTRYAASYKRHINIMRGVIFHLDVMISEIQYRFDVLRNQESRGDGYFKKPERVTERLDDFDRLFAARENGPVASCKSQDQ